MRRLILGLLVLLVGVEARADLISAAVRAAARAALRRAGQEATVEATELLARRMATVATQHGEELVCTAVQRVGPRALLLVEESGTHSAPALRMMAQYGERGAVAVARPQSLRLLAQYGEREVGQVLVKHPVIAEQLVGRYGSSAAHALGVVEGQGARRLAIMAEEGALEKIGRTSELLEVIGKHGQAACDFIWRNKGALMVGTTLTAFLIDPEPFISGAKEITGIVAENVVKPLAEVPGIAAREAAGEIARKTNWTLLLLALIACVTLLVWLWRRTASGKKEVGDA
jgi:hypothetical protein